MRGKLLEYLAKNQGCWISDLRTPGSWPSAIRCMQGLPPDQYSCEEWEYSLSYIFGTEIHFASYQEVTEYLLQLPA